MPKLSAVRSFVIETALLFPGPQFPHGYNVIQGDWSLLDKVRDRPTFYRTETR